MRQGAGRDSFLVLVRGLPGKLADRLAFVLEKLDLQVMVAGFQFHLARLLLRSVQTTVIEDLPAVYKQAGAVIGG